MPKGLGYAKTANFVFSTASLLIAPMAVGLGINPADHSVGLVKNLQIKADITSAKLTQGVENVVVDTQTTGMSPKVTAEIYEFTTRNVMLGLGQDVTALGADYSKCWPLAADVVGGATTATLTGDATTGTSALAVGDWFFLQDVSDPGNVFVSQISIAPTVAANVTTLTFLDAVPMDQSFSHLTSRAGGSTAIDANQDNMDTPYAVRIIGRLKSNGTPITAHFPKAKIVKGFDMSFTGKDFQNMPFEIDPLYPVETDAGYSPRFSYPFKVLMGQTGAAS